jgi:peptide/nickel transport system permease protein
MIVGLFVIGVFAPLLSPYDPIATNPDEVLQPPSWSHPFGTDNWGRDVMTRTFYATSIDYFIALASVLFAALVGSVIGSITGYIGGKIDEIIMRFMDIILAFPSFILGLGLMASLGPGIGNLVVAQTIVRLPIFSRNVRGQMLSVKENEYAEAARCVGNSRWRIMIVHLLPNCLTPILVLISLNFGYAILVTATLSFLGLGVNPPTPEWGVMISEGAPYLILGSWWLSIPGIFIIIAVLGFNLFGDGVRDLLK